MGQLPADALKGTLRVEFINSLGLAVVRPLTEKELVAAFSEYGEVISVSSQHP